MDGILNINKATGMTSHDVVAKIRNVLKQKRVGHAGTLDPAASGVLPICIGLGTRVAEYLSESGKAYLADIIFGIVTDTYDSEGSIIRTTSTADLSLSGIEEAQAIALENVTEVPNANRGTGSRASSNQPTLKRRRAFLALGQCTATSGPRWCPPCA